MWNHLFCFPDDESDSDAEEEQEKTVRPGLILKYTQSWPIQLFLILDFILDTQSVQKAVSVPHCGLPSCETAVIDPFLHPDECRARFWEKFVKNSFVTEIWTPASNHCSFCCQTACMFL